MCATGYYFLPGSYIRHVYPQRDCVLPQGALFFVLASGFNYSHTLLLHSPSESCVSRLDMKGNLFELWEWSKSPLFRSLLHPVLWGKEEPVKNPQCCLSSARYLGAAEGIKLYKNNPKTHECKGFLILKLNFWVDRIHAMLTAIQWQEVIKGVRFSILILGTYWLQIFLKTLLKWSHFSKLERFTIYLFC